jgi:hypothetical protein
MKNRYLNALKDSALSIVPIVAIVLVLSLVLHLNGFSSLHSTEITLLIIGMFVLIIGMALFQIGASTGLTKVGEYMGGSLSKQKNLFIIVVFSLALGALITCAEPSIIIVSKQVQMDSLLMIGSIALGVGVFVVIGVLRIIFHKSLKMWYLFFYLICFMLIIFVAMDPNKKAFLPFIFDSGGVTTGSATVPFILALGAGVAAVRGGKSAKSDSFGLVGLASIGPIITMTILILLQGKNGSTNAYTSIPEGANIFEEFLHSLLPYNGNNGAMIDVLIALSPIVIIFFIYELIFIKLPRRMILKLLFGFLLSFIGLSLFLTATSAVMTPLGASLGNSLGSFGVKFGNWPLILIAFVIGLVTILCEPAVQVLTTQMSEISDGQIKKSTVVLTLSIGVGVAIALAMIRALFNFSIVYYIIPGYLIAFALMFICPNIYIAMAFDSGGTASGPMSSSFVLPLIVGIATIYKDQVFTADSYDVFESAFGVVALIALTPIIAIQVLGSIQTIKEQHAKRINRRNVYGLDDAQIIHFK